MIEIVKNPVQVDLLAITFAPDILAAAAAKTTNMIENPLDIFTGLCSDPEKAQKIVKRVVGYGHESIAEHCSATFGVQKVSRVLEVDQVRHRIASYSVRAGLVTGTYLKVVLPEDILSLMRSNKMFLQHYMDWSEALRKMKNDMTAANIDSRHQRYLWPQGNETAFVMTMNFRELRHYLELRCCNKAQWEIQDLAWKIRDILVSKEELLPFFEDSGPACIRGRCNQGAASCGNPFKEVK